MATERNVSLNNPLKERDITTTSTVNKDIKSDVVVRSKGVKEGAETIRGRVKPAEAIVRCEMCGRVQKIVFPVGKPPEWHKCTGCNQIQPADGYHVVAYGLGLPRVLTEAEIKARRAELGE